MWFGKGQAAQGLWGDVCRFADLQQLHEFTQVIGENLPGLWGLWTRGFLNLPNLPLCACPEEEGACVRREIAPREVNGWGFLDVLGGANCGLNRVLHYSTYVLLVLRSTRVRYLLG